MFNRIKDGMYWDRAWKLVEGCTPVSEGCAHCWSARETHMRAWHSNPEIAKHNWGLTTQQGGAFNGKIRLREDNISLPLHVRKPTVFAIWNDLFHEDVPDDFIINAFRMMWTCNQHVFFVLTKRPDRMRSILELGEIVFVGDDMDFPAENVWLGVTAENQEQADKRIPILLQTPAAKRYVSIEPMLGPISLASFQAGKPASFLDWIICGGESGPGARPMHPDWVRSLRNQCQLAGIPFFFKQWGDRKVRTAADDVYREKKGGRILDGKEYLEVPAI